MIAASIAFTFRWDVTATQNGAARLDRWRGEIVECRYDVYKSAGAPLAARNLDCNPAVAEAERLIDSTNQTSTERYPCLAAERLAGKSQVAASPSPFFPIEVAAMDAAEMECRVRREGK